MARTRARARREGERGDRSARRRWENKRGAEKDKEKSRGTNVVGCLLVCPLFFCLVYSSVFPPSPPSPTALRAENEMVQVQEAVAADDAFAEDKGNSGPVGPKKVVFAYFGDFDVKFNNDAV